MPGRDVVLKLDSMAVKTRAFTRQFTLSPIGDVLFILEVPEGGFIEDEDGRVLFNLKGMRAIMRAGLTALTLDVDSEEFEGDF